MCSQQLFERFDVICVTFAQSVLTISFVVIKLWTVQKQKRELAQIYMYMYNFTLYNNNINSNSNSNVAATATTTTTTKHNYIYLLSIYDIRMLSKC